MVEMESLLLMQEKQKSRGYGLINCTLGQVGARVGCDKIDMIWLIDILMETI